jgi:hypothetical protein
MAEPVKPEKKKMPKGGRRGGTIFPKINLQKALEYGKKLVSKTHNGPQPEQTILVGVFNNKGPDGGIRASALKQYGLMGGDAVAGYVASQLARAIEAAVPEERAALARKAFLTPKLFRQVYDTLQPDTVSRARVRQVVVTANVHPDSADECVACFIDGAVHGGLGNLDGENIALTNAGTVAAPDAKLSNGQITEKVEEHEEQVEETDPEHEKDEAGVESQHVNKGSGRSHSGAVPDSGVRINLTVDSSSDPDKLEKQLKLLRQYGLLKS